MLYFNASQHVRLSPAHTCAYLCIPACPERHTENGLIFSLYSVTASLESWHMILLITGFSSPIVLPLPSKYTLASLSTIESYSQLSFHTDSQPYFISPSFRYSFQYSLVCSLVKSTNIPVPPHHVPLPGSSFMLSYTNISFFFISSRYG